MDRTKVLLLLLIVGCEGAGLLHGQRPISNRFDLIGSQRDANGLLLNPSWADTAQASALDPVADCGVLALHGTPGYRAVLLKDTECFGDRQRNILRLNEPRTERMGGLLCGQPAADGSVHGHLNWFPITLTGVLRYVGSLKGTGGDFDLTFELLSAARWPITRWNTRESRKGKDDTLHSIHLEFDYRETTARLAPGEESWWKDLHTMALDPNAGAVARADALLGPGTATVTGLFNLDAVHQGHAELHPVYAMAVLIRADTVPLGPIHERWAFMVRDRGNEGNCASGVVPLRLGADRDTVNWYRLLIGTPRADTAAPKINRKTSWIGATAVAPDDLVFSWKRGQGLQLAVRWPRPAPDAPDAVMLGVLDLSRGGGTPSGFAYMGLQEPSFKGRPSSEIVREARQLPAASLGPRSEAGEIASGKAKPHPPATGVADKYYNQLRDRRIVQVPAWTETLVQDTLPPAGPHVPAAAEIFEVIPPVVGCNEVPGTLNPRCQGYWSISPLIGLRLSDPARDGRRVEILASLGVESPHLEFGVHNVHLRPALAYALRRSEADTAPVSTQHRVSVQIGATAGPWGWTAHVFYLLVTPELGWDYDGRWQPASVASSFGIGARPRNGYQVDLAVEVLHWRCFCSGRPRYWAVVGKLPVVVF